MDVKIIKKNIKIIIFISVFFIFLLNPLFSFSRELEVDYPEIRGVRPQYTTYPIEDYVLYLYYFGIYTAGALALIIMILSGLTYLSSMGSPDKINEAKTRIVKAFLGLIIIISSHLMLKEISPNLLHFELEELEKTPVVEIPYTPTPVDYGFITHSPETLEFLERVDILTRNVKRESAKTRLIIYRLQRAAELCDCFGGQAVCSE